MVYVDYFDAMQVLREAGWKEAKRGRRTRRKEKNQRIFIKRYGGLWIEVTIYTEFSYRSMMLVAPLPRGTWQLPKEEQDAIWAEIHAHIRFEDLTPEFLDATAKRLAAASRKYAAPRKRATYEDFWWGDLSGKEAYDAWVKEVENVILRELRSTKDRALEARKHRPSWAMHTPLPLPFEKTHPITMNVLSNYVLEPQALTRREAQRKVRAILESMAKRGLIRKIPAGEFDRNIWWEAKDNENPRRRGRLPHKRKKNPGTVTNVGALVRKALS